MWLKKLIKKKYQFLLIALMLGFATIIFAACISFVAETTAYTKKYVSFENCPRLVTVTAKEYSDDYFSFFPSLMEKTDRIERCDATIFEKSLWFGDKQMKSYINLAYHVDDIDSFMHNLKLLEGKGSAPGFGEVWINSVTADTYGIKLNDFVRLGEGKCKSFRVSGIVATPVCPSPYMGLLPYYVNSETAKLLSGFPVTGFSFFSNSEMPASEYKELVPDRFFVDGIYALGADSIEQSISYLATIFGGVGILAALIVFVVSLVVIRFIIISTLAREYVEIGTYKALGFTEKEIVGFYLKSFAAAGAAGILLGGLISFPISHYLCNMVIRHLGTFKLTHLSIITTLGVMALLCVVLILGVLIALNRIKKVTPVEAFSINSGSSKKKIGKSLIKNAYSPLSVAINDITRTKSTTLITIAVLTVSFYMSILFLSLNYSLQRMDTMTGEWFCFPQYSAIVAVDGQNPAMDEFFENSEVVKKHVYNNTDVHLSGIRSKYDIDMNSVYANMFSDCSKEALGLPLVKGRHPASDEEILMSYDLSKKLGLTVGDWFSLENDTYSNDYLITGIYSTMFNGGLSIIIDGEEFSNFGKPDRYSSLLIFANDNVSYSTLEQIIKSRFTNVSISRTEAFLEGSKSSINSISKPLTTLFAVIFSLFSILNIINLLIMNNIENRRQYGVLKAMGFTNGYICLKNLLRIALLAVLSAALAVLIHSVLSEQLFFAIIHVYGLILNSKLTALVTAVLFAIIILTTAMFTLPLRKISPTELMEE